MLFEVTTEIVMLVSGLAFLSVFLFIYGIDQIIASRSDTVGSRLDRYATRVIAAAEETNQSKNDRGLFGKRLQLGTSKQLAIDLGRADLKLTPSEFIGVNLLSIAGGAALGLFIGRGNILIALLGALIGFYAPRLYLNIMMQRRLTAFNNQLGDTLILLANSLRSGYSLLQSMETVSRELPPPMSVEFSRVVREIGLGLSIEEALQHMLERVRSEDLDLVVTAISIQHEVGGNLSEILDTISHTIRERIRIKGQIRAMTASQRLSGNVVALLPVALGFFMYTINPGYLENMWKDVCGITMIIIGIVTVTLGYFAIRRITAIEV